jgi:hypothetical protein
MLYARLHRWRAQLAAVIGTLPVIVAPAAEIESGDAVVRRSVRLDNGSIVRIVKKAPIVVNPARDLHGPCVVRAANGDLLLCHQDSLQHGGGDGYVHQWRSTDCGATWSDEGPAADWRDRGLDALFGEYGNTADGKLIMFVQRRKPLGGDLGILR